MCLAIYYMNERLLYGFVESPTERLIDPAPTRIAERGNNLHRSRPKSAIDSNDTAWVIWTNYEDYIPNIQLASKKDGETSFRPGDYYFG